MRGMDAISRHWRRVLPVGLALLVMALCATPAFATGVTLPTTGVDVDGTIDAAVTALGAIAATAVAAWAAFKVVKMGLRWFSRIGG